MGNYRSSNARIAVLTVNMVLFAMVLLDPKDDTAMILALGFGSLNMLAMFDCLRQRAREQDGKDETNSNP